MKNIEVINKEFKGFRGEAWLIKKKGKYYAVSRANVPHVGIEVMIFNSSDIGVVEDWSDQYCERGVTMEKALEGFDNE